MIAGVGVGSGGAARPTVSRASSPLHHGLAVRRDGQLRDVAHVVGMVGVGIGLLAGRIE
jgi:hypothetical protein